MSQYEQKPMELIGEVIQECPIETGEGKKGTWKKQPIIIQTLGQYPKKVCVTLWGDKIGTASVGDTVTASLDLESREYNGKWYSEIKAWKIVKNESGQNGQKEDLSF